MYLSVKFVIITADTRTPSSYTVVTIRPGVKRARRLGTKEEILMTSNRTGRRQKTVYRSIINLEHSDGGYRRGLNDRKCWPRQQNTLRPG